jgi:hypothetical protein
MANLRLTSKPCRCRNCVGVIHFKYREMPSQSSKAYYILISLTTLLELQLDFIILFYNNAIEDKLYIRRPKTPRNSYKPRNTKIIHLHVPSVKGPLLYNTISIVRVAWVWFTESGLWLVLLSDVACCALEPFRSHCGRPTLCFYTKSSAASADNIALGSTSARLEHVAWMRQVDVNTTLVPRTHGQEEG